MVTNAHRGVSVRLATPEDADGVTAALEAAFPILMATHYDPEVMRRALPLVCRANPALLRSGTYFVAMNPGGSIVGCGGWSPGRPGDGLASPGSGHLRHFATDAAWIGRGGGRSIYSCAELQAQGRGFRTFETYAGLNAVGFYRALGFEEIGPLDFELAPGIAYPSIHMSRDIQSRR